MFLSIIIPVYNVEKYLRECLDSALNQDIPSSDYEIICVDDGSPDNCPIILDEYCEKYKNIKVIHKQNGGVSSARNAGLNVANGDYIWFLDSDDFISADVLGGIKTMADETDADLIKILPFAFNDGENYNMYSVLDKSKISALHRDFLWTMIIKHSAIKKSGVKFNEKMSYCEDNVFGTCVSPYLHKSRLFDDKLVYFYRQRAGSLASPKTETRIRSFIEGSDELLKLHRAKITDNKGYFFSIYQWMAFVMKHYAALPSGELKTKLAELKQRGLYPLPLQLKWKYSSQKPEYGTVKKLKHFLYDTSYTRLSFLMLRILYKIGRF